LNISECTSDVSPSARLAPGEYVVRSDVGIERDGGDDGTLAYRVVLRVTDGSGGDG
jgi:hypothetical protein